MRDRLPVHAGEYIRVPDAPSAKWRRVLRVYRRDGAVWVKLRRSRTARDLGLTGAVRLRWSDLAVFGVGIKKHAGPADRPAEASRR